MFCSYAVGGEYLIMARVEKWFNGIRIETGVCDCAAGCRGLPEEKEIRRGGEMPAPVYGRRFVGFTRDMAVRKAFYSTNGKRRRRSGYYQPAKVCTALRLAESNTDPFPLAVRLPPTETFVPLHVAVTRNQS